MTLGTDVGTETEPIAESLRRSVDRWHETLRRNERALWTLALTVLVGDLATTMAGVHLGMSESNPAVVASLHAGGVAGFVLLKVGVVATGVALRHRDRRYGPIAALGIALPWSLATLNNVFLLLAVL